ncbi:MAG: TIR domain-containing protein [Planctomycetota bacterium]
MSAFDVFLCYNRADQGAAVELAESLRDEGLRVWVDVWELRPGQSWTADVERILDSVGSAAIVVGPSGIGRSQDEEMRACIAAFREHGRPVIPVLLPGSAPSQLPVLLSDRARVELRDDRRQHAVEQLVWGITGQRADEAPDAPAAGLAELRELNRAELCHLVIVDLLDHLGFESIRVLDGASPLTVDVVCSEVPRLRAPVRLGVIALTEPVGTGHRDAVDGKTLRSRVERALTVGDDGDGFDSVFLISPYDLTGEARVDCLPRDANLARRVTVLAGAGLLTRVQEHVPELLSSFRSEQSRYVYGLCRRFLDSSTLRRLGAQGSASFLGLYTGGDLSPIDPDDARYISFATGADVQVRLSAEEALGDVRCAVVLADVGAGKTTFLQKRAIDLCGFGTGVVTPQAGRIPVFVPLSALSTTAVSSQRDFESAVALQISERDGLHTFSLSGAKDYVLLLDGFDELTANHIEVAEYIEALAPRFAAVILTSRPSRIPRLRGGFRYFRLNPFSKRHVQDFLAKWFPDVPSRRDDLYERIVSSEALLRFCRSPLMLTLYAALGSRVDKVGALPDRRTDIYARMVEMLLGRWDQIRDVQARFSPDLKEHALQLLAHDAHTRRTKTFQTERLENSIREALEAQGLAREVDVSDVLEEIYYRSSLIRRGRKGEMEFAHLSFQEFLCARRLREVGDSNFVQRHLTDEWWRTVLAFYFGIARSMDSIKLSRSLRKEHGNGLRLVEFLAEADRTNLARRAEIEKLLASDLLRSGSLRPQDLEVCQRLGDPLVELLAQIVNAPDFQGSLPNYFSILRHVGSDRAAELLSDSSELVCQLDYTTLISVLTADLERFDPNRTRLLQSGLEELAEQLGTRRPGDDLQQRERALAPLLDRVAEVSARHDASAIDGAMCGAVVALLRVTVRFGMIQTELSNLTELAGMIVRYVVAFERHGAQVAAINLGNLQERTKRRRRAATLTDGVRKAGLEAWSKLPFAEAYGTPSASRSMTNALELAQRDEWLAAATELGNIRSPGRFFDRGDD